MKQSSLVRGKTPHPYNIRMPALSWGKVVARNSDNTVDIALQNGSTYQHVQIGANTLGSQVGSVYIPTHGLTNPIQTPDGIWDTPIQSTEGDLFAIVGFLDGMSRQPKILGFFNPQQTEMSFSTLGIKVDRHESGVYNVTLPSGHDEKHFPDGSYIVFGDTASHDMTTENENWNPPTQSTPGPFKYHHASGFEIIVQPNGSATINLPSTLNLSGNVSVGSGTHPVALADLLITWLNSHTHTSASSGSPTSAPITPVSGISSTNLTTS